jgi:hypothetical protein
MREISLLRDRFDLALVKSGRKNIHSHTGVAWGLRAPVAVLEAAGAGSFGRLGWNVRASVAVL